MTLKPFDFETHVVARHPEAQFREVGEEIFLVHPDGEQMQNLNPTAAALWRLLEHPMTGRDMAEVFQAAFPIMAPAKIQVDIEAVINELLAGGYVQIKK